MYYSSLLIDHIVSCYRKKSNFIFYYFWLVNVILTNMERVLAWMDARKKVTDLVLLIYSQKILYILLIISSVSYFSHNTVVINLILMWLYYI